jgi:hypothetical protein
MVCGLVPHFKIGNAVKKSDENLKLAASVKLLSSAQNAVEIKFDNAREEGRDSSVVQRWATGWMIWGSSTCRGRKYISSPPRTDRFWGTPSPLSNAYRGLKLTTHLHLEARWRICGAIPPPQYVFMVWCLVKQAQGQFYITSTLKDTLLRCST